MNDKIDFFVIIILFMVVFGTGFLVVYDIYKFYKKHLNPVQCEWIIEEEIPYRGLLEEVKICMDDHTIIIDNEKHPIPKTQHKQIWQVIEHYEKVSDNL